jgi:hypothetical protein
MENELDLENPYDSFIDSVTIKEYYVSMHFIDLIFLDREHWKMDRIWKLETGNT